MLLSPGVRRSRRSLFIACTMIVGGVLVNRLNVFVVGYRPPISEANYSPAIGEILVTVGLIAALMFLYRAIVTVFARAQQTGTGGVCMTRTGPVIFGFVVFALVGICCYGPALAAADTAAEQSPAEKAAWSAPDQEAAKKRAAEVVPFVEAVMDECRLCRQQRLRDMGLGVKDQSESYFLLDSPIIQKRKTTTDRCVSCTPSTPTLPRIAPCATTIVPWTRPHRKPHAVRPVTSSPFRKIIPSAWGSRPPIISSAWVAINR
jgi:uncharacterized membrane protein